MLGNVRLPEPMLFQLCPSAADLPQFAEHGGAQTKVWKGPTLRYRKVQDLEQDELYRAYMAAPIFRSLCARIIEAPADRVSLYRTMFFNKPAASGVLINWHQDGNPAPTSGWGLTIAPRVTVWTALDRCTVANGALSRGRVCH
jgi:hypothetical protein